MALAFGTLLVLASAQPSSGQASDLYLEGTDAEALALGGAITAAPGSPLAALAFNPAGLTEADGWRVTGSLTGSLLSGEYANRVSAGNGVGQGFGGMGSLGVSYARGDLTLGFAAQPINAYLADWNYPDVPGTAGAVYEGVDQRALFVNYRLGLGAAFRLSEQVRIGVSAGLVYNRNELDAPYVFQSQPALQGLKVDVDLVTDTYAPNVNVGVVFTPVEVLDVGLSYTSATSFTAGGEVTGSAAAQFAALGLAGAPGDFAYDAEVSTGLPQMISLGVALDATDRLALFGQVDWVDWSGEFDALGLRLENGTNAAINGVVGSEDLTDVSPLDWESRLVARFGLAYAYDEAWTGRLGYSHTESPVPDTTFTPLSGLITEHTLSAGFGWERGDWGVGFAYQLELPSERAVGESVLLSGEYSNTRTEVSIHRITLTGSRAF